jgi:hypothetical protein
MQVFKKVIELGTLTTHIAVAEVDYYPEENDTEDGGEDNGYDEAGIGMLHCALGRGKRERSDRGRRLV